MSDTPRPTWTIRPAKPEEQGDLSRLAVRATRHIGYDDAFIDRIMPALTILHPMIVQGDILVAEDADGSVRGVIGVSPSMQALTQLFGIFVDPSAWRAGAGRALFDAIIGRVKELKAGAMIIHAEPSAVGFYLHMGAVKIGTAPYFLSPEVTLTTMIYILPAEPEEAA